MTAVSLPDGVVAFVKAECPTCVTVAPVLSQLLQAGVPLTVYTQDDPAFPPGLEALDDTSLERSYRMGIEVVPTLMLVSGGEVVESEVGWLREGWEALTGVAGLGPGLPPHRPGCGSRTLDLGMPERLAARFGGEKLRSRRVELASLEDEFEAMHERGWTDGLPVVPPTRERVLRMLAGTSRDPGEVVAVVPPDLAECTVEKVAINAVLAGCRPDYLPVVLAAVEAACTDEFNIHGLLATTWFSGPLVIVNGPVAERIGMNSGVNALGQGNRANASIGRALQLVVRNVGGGRPGGVDRAALGNPGKYTFCFAEREQDSPWEPLSVERGLPPGASAVTLFAASGVQAMADQLSRTPESLARSMAACLRVVGHPKLALGWDAFLVISPEHARTFRQAGWSKQRLRQELAELLTLPGAEMVRGAGGIAEGLPESMREAAIPKFRDGGLWLVHAGGTAGMFSAIIGGWVSGSSGSQPVTVEVRD
jgi:hypothetical protein